jgi:hypothetical protein
MFSCKDSQITASQIGFGKTIEHIGKVLDRNTQPIQRWIKHNQVIKHIHMKCHNEIPCIAIFNKYVIFLNKNGE